MGGSKFASEINVDVLSLLSALVKQTIMSRVRKGYIWARYFLIHFLYQENSIGVWERGIMNERWGYFALMNGWRDGFALRLG